MTARISSTLVWALILLAFLMAAQAQDRPGSVPLGGITGVITTVTGAPAPVMLVAAMRIFPVGGTAANPPIATTISNTQGQYSISSVFPGSYKLCVVPEGLPLLDPCRWSESPAFTNVRPNVTSRLNVVVEEGTWLNVHVDDPDDEFGKKERAKPNERALNIGVRAAHGLTAYMSPIFADANGRNYRIAVPSGKDLSIEIDGGDTDLEDKSGKVVGRGQDPVQVRLGTRGQTLELKVKKTPPGQNK